MIGKELQDLAWALLPKEFKEEVKKEWRRAYYNDTKVILEYFFGIHNLTSDAEREEMLTVSRKEVQEMYSVFEEFKEKDNTCFNLETLFGSKCLPDEPSDVTSNVANSEPKSFKYSVGQKVILHFYGGEVSMITEAFYDGWKRKYKVKALPHHVWNENELDPYEEPQPAEPKFKVGDTASYVCSPTVKHKCTVTKVMQNEHSGKWEYNVLFDYGKPGLYISESDLEPYTEPQPATERSNLNKESSTCTDDCPSQCSSKHRNLLQETVNCDKQLDNILKDSFRNERRLNIAAMIVQGVLSNPNIIRSCSDFEDSDEYIVKTALMYTDTFLDECEKGGCYEKA